MVKRVKLPTRGFGAEPGQPDPAALAGWIAEHRGHMADIITYQLDRSLAPQVEAGIETPCAGGKFYADRILAAFSEVCERKATGEIHVDTRDIVEDAAGIVVRKKGAWGAMPAPHVLDIEDRYYYDNDEWSGAICEAYGTLMRTMRDTGIAGHVLVCDAMQETELAALARQKIFFFQPKPNPEDLAMLMEHQDQVAVGKECLKTLFNLTSEYTLKKVFIIDPDKEAIALALTHLDPDQVVAGGYCTKECDTYWKDLFDHAAYVR